MGQRDSRHIHLTKTKTTDPWAATTVSTESPPGSNGENRNVTEWVHVSETKPRQNAAKHWKEDEKRTKLREQHRELS
jgi:hypothetical protein